MELWNKFNLNAPPRLTCEVQLQGNDVANLLNMIKNGVEFYMNQQFLNAEAALVSRIIYRMKMKFRNSKDFKVVEKLNRCLINYLNLNISKILHNFYQCLPYNQNGYRMSLFLPTRNMLDYVLVRLQGLSKLLERILGTCKIVAEMALQRMRLGHYWQLALTVLSISSRIFFLVRIILKQTCDLYLQLLPYRKKLRNPPNNDWLGPDYNLPENLNDWLTIDWVELERTVIEIPDEEEITAFFDLINDSDDDDDDDDEDVQISDEYFIIREDDEPINIEDESVFLKNETIDDFPLDDVQEIPAQEVDVGEPVQRSKDVPSTSLPDYIPLVDDPPKNQSNEAVKQVGNTPSTPSQSCTDVIILEDSPETSLSILSSLPDYIPCEGRPGTSLSILSSLPEYIPFEDNPPIASGGNQVALNSAEILVSSSSEIIDLRTPKRWKLEAPVTYSYSIPKIRALMECVSNNKKPRKKRKKRNKKLVNVDACGKLSVSLPGVGEFISVETNGDITPTISTPQESIPPNNSQDGKKRTRSRRPKRRSTSGKILDKKDLLKKVLTTESMSMPLTRKRTKILEEYVNQRTHSINDVAGGNALEQAHCSSNTTKAPGTKKKKKKKKKPKNTETIPSTKIQF